jgi:GNAT superfamily N-acetyltransferase
VRIRPFATGDADAVEAINDASYGDDPRVRGFMRGSHGEPREHPRRRSVVAELDGTVVGAGTIFHGTDHPAHSRADVVVAPAVRRRGIGSALLDALRAQASRPLIARVHCDREGAIPFAQASGLELVNRSWEGTLDVDLLDLPARVDEPPSLEEAAAFFARWYDETHQWSPPAPKSHEEALALFCGETMVEGSLVGVRRGGALVGAATVSRLEGHLRVVWCGGEGVDRLLGACVAFASGKGEPLQFEVDEANASFHAAVDELGVLGEPALAFFEEPA